MDICLFLGWPDSLWVLLVIVCSKLSCGSKSALRKSSVLKDVMRLRAVVANGHQRKTVAKDQEDSAPDKETMPSTICFQETDSLFRFFFSFLCLICVSWMVCFAGKRFYGSRLQYIIYSVTTMRFSLVMYLDFVAYKFSAMKTVTHKLPHTIFRHLQEKCHIVLELSRQLSSLWPDKGIFTFTLRTFTSSKQPIIV